MAGNSSRQYSHQVAQKARNTTLPRKSLMDTFFPAGSGRVKSGAGGRSLTSTSFGIALKSGDSAAITDVGKNKAAKIAAASFTRCISLLQLFQLRDQLVVRRPRILLRDHLLVADDALFVHDEPGALRDPALGIEHAVGLDCLEIRRIGQQRIVELDEIGEGLLGEAHIRADAHDLGAGRLELRIVVPTGRQFLDSRRREIDQVELDDDVFLALQVGELEVAALGAGQVEVGRLVADFERRCRAWQAGQSQRQGGGSYESASVHGASGVTEHDVNSGDGGEIPAARQYYSPPARGGVGVPRPRARDEQRSRRGGGRSISRTCRAGSGWA